ncbi:MAG: cupredoxin domain-containing protein [Candidatus Binatia bacterium]
MKRLLRISLGIMLGGTVAASGSPALASYHAREPTAEVKLDATEFAFEPATFSVDPGEVTFVITNRGRYPHSFAIEGVAGKTSRIQPGETAKITLALSRGNYTVYCFLKGHRERGMVATLSVGAIAEKPAPKPEPKPAAPGYY